MRAYHLLADNLDKPDGALSALYKVLCKASEYDSGDMACLANDGDLILGHPDGVFFAQPKMHQILLSEVLIGYGFVSPRKPEDIPKRIPSDLWNYSVARGSVSGNSLTFDSVRIVSYRTVEGFYARTAENKAPKPVGHRPVKNHVFEAFETLASADGIDFSQPMSRTYEPIRAWLSNRFPERALEFSDLSDETIRKVVSPEFKPRRKTKKQ